MASTSPARRRLALLLSLTGVLTFVSLRPPAPAQSQVTPETVARHVDVPVASLAKHLVPGRVLVDGDVLRSLAPVRTPFEPVCSSIWSTMVAFAWHQSDGQDVRTSVETPRGASVGILQDQDADPDPNTPEYHPDLRTSPLYWTRGSRCVRLSLRMPAGVAISDLHADFINTSGTADAPGTEPPQSPLDRALGFVGGIFAPPSAEATAPQPRMIRRSEWGAAKPRPHCFSYVSRIKMAYIHHTSGTNSYSPSKSDDIMRGIQYYHMRTRGYCDIAYNFLVDKYGTIFVGRAGSLDTDNLVVPGSQAGFNTYTFSVSAMGNYQSVSPSQATVSSIERLVAWRLDEAHLPPDGTARMTSSGGPTTKYKAGTTVTLPLISGHRQTGITDCPGNRLWARLDQVRLAVFDMGRPKIFRPRQSSHTFTPVVEADRFTATASDPLSWEVVVTDRDGQTVRTLSAGGSSLDVSWDGTDDYGAPVAAGRYTATVEGSSSDGKAARSAVLTLNVSVEPSPSPSPTTSPSPTPTVSPT